MARNRRPQRGFSIIESMVAIVVLSIGVFSFLAILPMSYKNTNLDSQRVQALGAGHAYMDQIRYYIKGNPPTGSPAGYPVAVLPAAPAVSIDFGKTIFGTGQAANGNVAFTFVQACTPVGGSALEFDCIVTVSWTTSSISHVMNIESYVTTET